MPSGCYAHSVFRRLSKLLLVLAMVSSIGAHWLLLQAVAWTAMLAANMSCDSFSESVSKTFDGEHPCPLCQTITAGKKSEQKSAITAPNLKMEFPPASENFVLIVPSAFELLFAANTFAESVPQKPPLPPPRNLFV